MFKKKSIIPLLRVLKRRFDKHDVKYPSFKSYACILGYDSNDELVYRTAQYPFCVSPETSDAIRYFEYLL